MPNINLCEKKGIALCLESPLHIKRSMGLVRGKDDQIDAIRIAQYAYDHKDKLKLVLRMFAVVKSGTPLWAQ